MKVSIADSVYECHLPINDQVRKNEKLFSISWSNTYTYLLIVKFWFKGKFTVYRHLRGRFVSGTK